MKIKKIALMQAAEVDETIDKLKQHNYLDDEELSATDLSAYREHNEAELDGDEVKKNRTHAGG